VVAHTSVAGGGVFPPPLLFPPPPPLPPPQAKSVAISDAVMNAFWIR
jgi:hypothetical protein